MRKEEVIIGTIFLVVGAVFFLIGQTRVDNAWYSYPNVNQTMNQGNILRLFGLILFIIGLVCLVVGLAIQEKLTYIKSTKTTPISSTVSNNEAQNILKTRYAKGEITKEQYEQMKMDLEK